MRGTKGLLSFALVPLDEARRAVPAGARWAAVASGLVVAGPVAQTFVSFDGPTMLLAPLLALLAFLCTMAGTLLAIRASTGGKATLWVLAANVMPPTLLCLPTIYGLVFATPSGLLAFVVVLPLALWARHIALDGAPHGAERMRLASALFLGTTALCLVSATFLHLRGPREPWEATPNAWFLLAPTVAVSLAAIASALGSLLPDLYRVRLRARVASGRMGSLRLREEGTSAVLEHAVSAGAGPMRSGTTSEALGVLNASPLRVGLGLACLGLGVLPLFGAALAAL